MKMTKTIRLTIALLFLSTLGFSAQPAAKKIYTTHHINPHAPSIDGRINDAAWEKVEWSGDFTQIEPYEGKTPSQPTAFKVLYDGKNLYIAIRAFDAEPQKIERRMARRDTFDGDWVEISLDSYCDQRTAFSFGVNAVGVKGDQVLTKNGENEDPNWDPIWFVKTAIDPEGWSAEMRIPFTQLRFKKQDSPVWGLQVSRKLFRSQEISAWQFIPKDSPGVVHLFGELRGIERVDSPRLVQLAPYSVGQAQFFRREPGNPYATGKASGAFGGLDGKIGVTHNLTLDFTINPDFGQVEADPSVVNLTAFETYYEEKRPFFIEGSNIIHFNLMGGDGDFSRDNLFYSRRIGRTPQRVPSIGSGEYADIPETTSILGAFKLTGKTAGGLSIGILDGVTAEETAGVSFLNGFREERVEPMTNYFALRLQQDFSKGDTIVGGMVTAVNRRLGSGDFQFLHDSAYTAGFDISHSWKQKTYFLSFKSILSFVHGSTEAILRTQLSPLRYFQRPDAGHLSLDPNRTSLSGHGGTLEFGKFGGGHLMFSSGLTWRSPGLELNDIGYLRYSDVLMQWSWAGYRIWEPFSVFREVRFNFNEWKGWDFSGQGIFMGGNVNAHGTFKNYWQVGFGINRQFESLSAGALRGGPLLRVPGGWNLWWSVGTDNRKKLKLNFSGSQYAGDHNNSRSSKFEFGLTFIPSQALSFTVSPFMGFSGRKLQYITTRDFFGASRYILGTINQKTFGLTLRLNWSLTPDLSIQYYGQPFVAAGDYQDLKKVMEPRAARFEDRFAVFSSSEIRYDPEANSYSVDENGDGSEDYVFSNPDFNFFQFRSNLVFRWEYIPGSSLYLVWSQGRTGYGLAGDFTFREGLEGLADIHPHNVFLVKLSYCFNL